MSAALTIASANVASLAKATTFKSANASKAVKGFVSNASIKKTTAFQVWQPVNNKFFETFSYLPPLSNDDIVKQVDYIVRNGWTPCLEFSDSDSAYTANTNTVRMNVSSGYYDNRYWSMWKLPMFGCTDGTQVVKEITACTKAFPDAYIRLVAFDAVRQVQITGFLVHRPPSANDYRKPSERSV